MLFEVAIEIAQHPVVPVYRGRGFPLASVMCLEVPGQFLQRNIVFVQILLPSVFDSHHHLKPFPFGRSKIRDRLVICW